MSVLAGQQSTEGNFGSIPAAHPGYRLGVWQAGIPYADPNNPGYFIRDASVELPNVAGINIQAGASYNATVADLGYLIELTYGSPGGFGLPDPATVPTFFWLAVVCASATTITPAAGLINGLASIPLPAGGSCFIFGNGTKYRAIAVTLDTSGFATKAGVQQESYTYAADTGAANAYAVALTPAIGAYAEGLEVTFKAAHANTGASTLAVNGLATKAIKKSGSTALVSGDILVGQIITVKYDGTNFQVIGGGGGGGLTVAGSSGDLQ